MRMRRADYGPGWIASRGIRSIWGFVLNVFLILMGLFMLGGGTYVSPVTLPPSSLIPISPKREPHPNYEFSRRHAKA